MKRCAMCGNKTREFGVVGAGGFREVCPRCIDVIQDGTRNLGEAFPAKAPLLTSENALRFLSESPKRVAA